MIKWISNDEFERLILINLTSQGFLFQFILYYTKQFIFISWFMLVDKVYFGVFILWFVELKSFFFFNFEMLYSSWQGVVQDLWKILWPLDSTLVSKSLWESMERNKILVTNYPIIYCFKVAGMAKKFQIFSSNWWSYCSLFLPTWFEVGAICLS